jgi:hypothetical protein
MRIEPEVSGASIVLLGSFNPRIFRPDWLQATGIIGDNDSQAATIEIIHSAVSGFSLEWAKLQVDQNRFAVETVEPPFIRIRDLVLKAFKEFLPHTPVHQVGINRSVHFSVGTFENREKIGKMLAPLEPWGAWASKIPGTSNDLKLHGGMKSLLMTQMDRGDGYRGSITARVEPSVLPQLNVHGIFMEVNDHFVIEEEVEKILGSDAAMDILENQWTISIDRSEWIIDQIMALKAK